MKPFRFQKFDVLQSNAVFRVGTDAVLLGVLSSIDASQNILEVGTGTGVISLMLAQRNHNCRISALDLQLEAVELAKLNFHNSPFRNRLDVFCGDFISFDASTTYDAIVSNPPFFVSNPSEKDKIARQQITLQFSDLIQKSTKLLNESGILSVIIPAESKEKFIQLAFIYGFFLKRCVNVYGILGGPLKRNILEFSKHHTPTVTEDFVIEKSPRNFSDEYLELTREFHVFNK